MFIHCDAHWTPLQCPYEGSFKVIESGPKTSKIDIGEKTETVTNDRLKSAYLDLNYPV